MSFGTPYLIGSTAGTTATSQVITSGTATAAGDTIIVDCGNSSAAGATITGVADSKGNTYAAANSAVTAGEFGHIWIALNTTALAVSDTITITFSTTTGSKACMAIGVSGVATSAAVDQAPAGTHATSTAPSVTSGTLSQATELAIGVINSQSTGGVPSGLGSFTSAGSAQSGSSPEITIAYLATAATTAVTFSGTIVSANWCAMLITLLPAAGGGPPAPLYPPKGPARARIAAIIPKGRARGSQGTSGQTGPALIPPRGPSRFRAPGPFRKGRAQGSQGTSAGLGPPIIPPAGPAGLGRRAPGPFRKGRAQGNPGAPVQNVAPATGPPIIPPQGPAGLGRRAPGPFRKGRSQGTSGTSGGTGPPVIPQRGPAGLVRRAPGPWRKGRAQGNPGGPVVPPAPIGPINTWTASRQINGPGFGYGAPANGSLDCAVASTAGNWLIAICSWTLPPGYLGCTMEIADDVHGFWIPLGAPSGDSSAAGMTRCSIWARPGGSAQNPVPGAGHVYAAPAGMPGPVYPAVIGMTVIEVTGMSPYAGIPAVVTASSNGATTVSAGAPGPLSQAFMVTVAASDNAVFSSGPGGTWTSLTAVNVSAGAPIILHTAPAYQVASSAQAATWATATASDLSACTAVILVSSPAPVQPNPNWPYTQLQAAFGSGALTPRSQMTWTDITPRFLAGQEASVQRGKNRQLDQVQSSAITLTLSNSDSALDPGNTSSPYYPNVVADTPMRLLMTWQGRTYSQFSGYVEKWPQTWKPSTRQGLATVTITDAWSLMINQLSSCQQSEILLGQPYAYWPCGDVVGSSYAQNYAPGNSSVLQQVLSKSGALTAVAAFGAVSGVNDGDPSGTMWQQSGLTSGSQGYGYCLTCADQNYPPLSGGVTITGWFDPTGGATQLANGSILIRAVNSALGPVAQVSLNSPSGGNPGGIAMTVWDKVTRVPTVTQVNTQNWLVAPLGGDLHITLLLTQTTWRVIVNGGNFTGASGTCNLPAVMSWLSFMGASDRFGTGYMFNGACGHLAVFPVLLTDDRVAQIVIAGYPNTNGGQFQGEAPHTRIERLAGYGGWSGPRAIGTSGTTQIAAITDIQGSGGRISASGHVQAAQGQQAGQAVTNIVASDNGFMAVDGNGVLCYQSRGDFYGLQPAWLLGENTSGGEIPYLGDVTFSEDKALLYNVAQLTQSTGTGVAVVATNGPSALQHGDSPYTATAYLSDINAVADEANWIVNTQGTPVNRFESATVDAAANSANWPFVLGIEPATPVQVTRRPVTASSPTVVAGISAQVTRKFDAQAGVARVTLTGDTFPEGQVLTADSPTLGLLNGINRLAW